jgi:hypothetical protein
LQFAAKCACFRPFLAKGVPRFFFSEPFEKPSPSGYTAAWK